MLTPPLQRRCHWGLIGERLEIGMPWHRAVAGDVRLRVAVQGRPVPQDPADVALRVHARRYLSPTGREWHPLIRKR